MNFFSAGSPETTEAQQREGALQSAIVLRDCSLRVRSTAPERRACRALMRLQAAQWRQAGDAGE